MLQQLPQQPAAGSAQRRSDGQLALTSGRSREQQVRDVDAGDQQHEKDRAEQDQQRPPDVADDFVVESNEPHADSCIHRVLTLEP